MRWTRAAPAWRRAQAAVQPQSPAAAQSSLRSAFLLSLKTTFAIAFSIVVCGLAVSCILYGIHGMLGKHIQQQDLPQAWEAQPLNASDVALSTLQQQLSVALPSTSAEEGQQAHTGMHVDMSMPGTALVSQPAPSLDAQTVVEIPEGSALLAALKGELQLEQRRWAASTAQLGSSPPAPMPAPAQHDTCASALGISKVALLFLTRGDLYHEATWAAWFKHAAGLLPAASLRSKPCPTHGGKQGCNCSQDMLDSARQACADVVLAREGGPLRAQHLFSVHTHPLPEFGSFPEGSLFRGTEIPDRIQVAWGSFEMVAAARNLLRAALADALNQRFVLLSENALPLYPPTATYAQLMHEDKSRLDACSTENAITNVEQRFSRRMGWRVHEAWRKSSQWFALTRKHAGLAAADTQLLALFREHCVRGWDPDLNRRRACYPDEHYLPTLVAFLGLAEETDCLGYLMNTNWWQGEGSHPYSYKIGDISADMIAKLRENADKCDHVAAIRSSPGEFVHISALAAAQTSRSPCQQTAAGFDTTALSSHCPLFARKFPAETAAAVFGIFNSCASGLAITNSGACEEPGEAAAGEEGLYRRRDQRGPGINAVSLPVDWL